MIPYHYGQGRPLPMGQPGQSEPLAGGPPPPRQKRNKKKPLRLFSFANEEITMLQCYVLTCGRSVTVFLAPPRSQRPGARAPLALPKGRPLLWGTRWCCGWGTALQTGSSRIRFPMVSFGFFHWHNPSGRTMTVGSTQPLTEMSTRNISWE
jgi:hypothetical protein